MKIFADRHHDGLALSLRLLADRLDAEIFFPIGEEWFTQGYWNIARPYDNHPGTINQYLGFRDVESQTSDYYLVNSFFSAGNFKAITFEQFMAMDIDVIIASIPDHWITYKRLRDKCKPKAVVVCQMGNMFSEISELVNKGVVEALMASTIPFTVPSSLDVVFYHQEMPMTDYVSPPVTKAIKSFVHLLPEPELYEKYKKALPEFEWKAYGAGCPDGVLNGIDKVYEEMHESSFVWNVKPRGDGFGWNWHSAFMCGRPVITNLSDYQDKLGGLLFQDGVTGIDLEQGSLEENVKLIRELSKPVNLEQLCLAARARFNSVVNYEQEAAKIKEMIFKKIGEVN